jgi:osmoprotectant transport system substrate-binding protein
MGSRRAGSGREEYPSAIGIDRESASRLRESRGTSRDFRLLAAVVCLATLLSGCQRASQEPGTATALHDDAITIGSFDFGESELIAEIYALALEDKGFRIERMFGLGPRELVQPALADGLLEFVPEYSGTALQFLSLNKGKPASDVDGTHAALTQALTGSPLVAMAPAPAQDANAFVVTRATSQRHGLATISDLQEVAPDLTFGGPPECPTRPFCLLGLEQVYGLRFGNFLPLDASGPITHQALRDRYVDVALLFTTDPGLLSRDFVVLADDRRLQPAENVTPLVRHEVLARWGPEFEEIVDGVSRQMSTRVLRSLNAQVVEGMDPSIVAHKWLSSEGAEP